MKGLRDRKALQVKPCVWETKHITASLNAGNS